MLSTGRLGWEHGLPLGTEGQGAGLEKEEKETDDMEKMEEMSKMAWE